MDVFQHNLEALEVREAELWQQLYNLPMNVEWFKLKEVRVCWRRAAFPPSAHLVLPPSAGAHQDQDRGSQRDISRHCEWVQEGEPLPLHCYAACRAGEDD
jgi:hypothetical protein